jgi:hypothetical protein
VQIQTRVIGDPAIASKYVKLAKHHLLRHEGTSSLSFPDCLIITQNKTNLKRIIFICTINGVFLSIPRIYKGNDGYTNDLLAKGTGSLEYPLDSLTSQTLSIDDEKLTSVTRDDYAFGNIDWMGINTVTDGTYSDALILTWKGPTGRSIPYDFNAPIEGLTQSDIVFDILGTPKFTCFGPHIYENGGIAYTAPSLPTLDGIVVSIDIPTKVLGAAYSGSTLVCIVNNHYSQITGFREEVWINRGDFELYEEQDHPLGWRSISIPRVVGRPTQCWFFNQSGNRATQGVNEYIIDLENDVASFVVGTNTSMECTIDITDQGDNTAVYQGTTAVWSDYIGDERVFAAVTASGGQNFTGVNSTNSEVIDAPVYMLGVKGGTISVTVSGNQAMWTGHDLNVCPDKVGVWTISKSSITQSGVIDLNSSCGIAVVTYTLDGISGSAEVALASGKWVSVRTNYGNGTFGSGSQVYEEISSTRIYREYAISGCLLNAVTIQTWPYSGWVACVGGDCRYPGTPANTYGCNTAAGYSASPYVTPTDCGVDSRCARRCSEPYDEINWTEPYVFCSYTTHSITQTWSCP